MRLGTLLLSVGVAWGVAHAAPPTVSAELTPNTYQQQRRLDSYDGYVLTAGSANVTLGVWAELRQGTWQLCAARFNGTTLVDPYGFCIATVARSYAIPEVAWNGSAWLIAWQEGTTGKALRVDGAANVLDGAPFALPLAPSDMASDGIGWYVVGISGAGAAGVRVNANGQLLDASPVPITSGVTGVDAVTVGWDGTEYIAAWGAGGISGNVFYGRVSAAGAPLDGATGIVLDATNGGKDQPLLTCGGGTCLIGYLIKAGSSTDLKLARVQGTTRLDPNGIAVTNTTLDEAVVAVTWDGTQFFLMWTAHRTGFNDSLLATRVSSAGAVLDAPALTLSTNVYRPYTAAPLASGTAAVFFDYPGRMQLRSIPQTGPVDAMIYPVAMGANVQSTADVASDGTDYLMVWLDQRADGTYSVMGARIAANGTLTDPNGFVIATMVATIDQGLLAPRVAWAGTSYYVAWGNGTSASITIVGSAVSSAGVVAAPQGRQLVAPITTGTLYSLTVAGTSGQVIVAWSYGTGNGRTDVQRFALDGTPLDSSPTTVYSGVAQVAGNNGNWLMTWNALDGGTLDTWGSRIMPSPAAPTVTPQWLTSGTVGGKAVAGSGGWAVLANRSSGTVAALFDTTLAQVGTVNVPNSARLSGDGPTYLVLSPQGTAAAGRVAATAAWLDTPPGWSVSAPSPDAVHLESAIASAPGEYLVAYSRFDTAAPYFASRVFARRLSFNGTLFPGGSSATPLDGGPAGDGGSANDGGTSGDAGTANDAGTLKDGGATLADGGEQPLTDGGAELPDGGRAPGQALKVSCGCGATDGATAVWLLVPLGLLGRRRAKPQRSS